MVKIWTFVSFFFLFNTVSARTLTYGEVNKIALEAIQGYFSYIDTLETKDIDKFCPNYDSLSADERQRFFSHLLTSISFFESSFKLNTSFKENSGVSSKGLIGLSFGATQQKSYKKNGCYIIKTAEDILDPLKSMRCGMAIVETWMRKDNYLANQYTNSEGKRRYQGAARYWSTLRKPYQVTLKNYNNQVVTIGKRQKVIDKVKANFSQCF
jgi:hypothetical protein